MINLLNSRKGQGHNYFAVISVLVVFIVCSLIGYVLFDKFVEQFNATEFRDENTDKALEGFTKGMNALDTITVFIMVVLIVGIGITSYAISSAPAFFWISFIMGAFYGLGSYFFNYIFQELVSHSVFNTVIVHFPLSLIIGTNLHWIMLITWAVGSITLYAKKQQEGL